MSKTLYFISSTAYSVAERQTKKHGKVYDATFRVITSDGKLVQKKLCGFPTRTALKNAVANFFSTQCEVINKNVKSSLLLANQNELPFSKTYSEYIQSKISYTKESTIIKLQSNKHFYVDFFKNKDIRKITTSDIQNWKTYIFTLRNERLQKPYNPNYLLKVFKSLASFFHWVEFTYDIPTPMKKVPAPKPNTTSQSPMRIWTKTEFNKFLTAVTNPQYRALFATLFYTGRRKGEVLALTPSDFLSDCIIFNKTYTRRTIDGSPYKITSTKNNKVSISYICTPLKEILANYTFQSPFVFGGQHPINEARVNTVFYAAIAKSGVKPIRVHDLRHSFVSMCIHLGANSYVIADLIGDSVSQILSTYGHFYEDDKRSIINRIE